MVGITMKFDGKSWMITTKDHMKWREIARESIDADEGTNWFLFEDKLEEYLTLSKKIYIMARLDWFTICWCRDL